MLSIGRVVGVAAVAVIVMGLALVAEGRLVERFVWNELQFDWPSAAVKEAAISSEQVSVVTIRCEYDLMQPRRD